MPYASHVEFYTHTHIHTHTHTCTHTHTHTHTHKQTNTHLLDSEAGDEVSHSWLLVDLLGAEPCHKDGLLLLTEGREAICVTELCTQRVDNAQLQLVHLLPG